MENVPACYETNIGRKREVVSMHGMDSSRKKKINILPLVGFSTTPGFSFRDHVSLPLLT